MWVKVSTRVCAEAKNQAAVAAAGGIELVVAVLRRYEGNAAVAEHACGTLSNFVSLGECACVKQLHTCWYSEWMCGDCLCMLWVEASTRVCAEAKNQAEAAAAGGIEAVVAVLRRHEGNAAVAEHACRALRNIAFFGECACVEQPC